MYLTKKITKFQSSSLWLEEKRINDDTNGLWRVHDNLYDMTKFINSHPGGPSWLELTKVGTDITEAFEAHHITLAPTETLKTFFVRKATKSRNSPFTFQEDGFYRTLKKNVRNTLKNIPQDTSKTTNLIMDFLCASTFIFAILACKFNSLLFATVSGTFLTFSTICAHNYLHKKDNFRMYYFNLSMMDFREWRVFHVLSHHLFPNTFGDLEVTVFEPLVQYLPHKKSILVKYGSYVSVFLMFIFLFVASYAKQLHEAYRKNFSFSLIDGIPFSLPLIMYAFSGVPMRDAVLTWIFIVFFGSFLFGAIGFNAAHHHPDTFHEGDAPRDNLDWGIHQLDAVADRHEINGNIFLALTNFGDHGLHHLFPTIDHTTLPLLYPTLEKTMKQFDLSLDMRSQVDMIVGQFRQLSRDKPNKIPRGNKLRKPY